MSAVRVGPGLIAAGLFLAVFGPPRRIAQRMGSRLGRSTPVAFHRLLCFILRVKIVRRGEPSAAAQRLIVANHLSWLDIPILGAIEPMTFLAKKEVRGPFLGREVAGLQGVVYVDRQRKRLIPLVNSDMARAMRAGEPVVLFAEATTSDGNRLLRFRSSHFQAIRDVAVPAGEEAVIQPVFLHYHRLSGLALGRRERPIVAWYGDMTFLPHLRRFLASGGLSCDVYYGEPIRVLPEDDRKSLARATEQAVRRLALAAREAGREPGREVARSPIPAAPETR